MGNRFRIDIAYLYQEKIIGMPYAINLACNWLNNDLVLFGMPDTIIEPQNAFLQLLHDHQQNSSDLTLGLFYTDTPSKFGMVDTDINGNITCIEDKPSTSCLHYMWGCACWSPSFTVLLDNYLASNPYIGKEIVLGDAFQFAINRGLKVKGLKFHNGQYIDIGTVDELNSALKKFHL